MDGTEKDLTHGDRLLGFAREMRRSPTYGEKWLWSKLRDRRCCGVKFYRQRRFGIYIADFLCPDLKLVIELDGAGHMGQVEYDLRRKAYFEERGFTVVRIGSEISFSDGDDILPFIQAELQKRLGKERSEPPSPQGRGPG